MDIKKATLQDVNTLVELRKAQLIDAGRNPNRNIDKELTDYFVKALEDGVIIEFLAMEQGEVIASAALILQTFPPNFPYPTGKVGYICNVYTKPDFRGRGISTTLVKKIIAEAKQLELEKLWLLSSTMGKSVYPKLGFHQPGNYFEMDL